MENCSLKPRKNSTRILGREDGKRSGSSETEQKEDAERVQIGPRI
jgi:hypothetical protein